MSSRYEAIESQIYYFFAYFLQKILAVFSLITDLKEERTFERLYSPLEEIAVPLNTAWATVKNLNYATDGFHKTFSRVIFF